MWRGTGARPHHTLWLSPRPWSCYFCASCEFSVQHSAGEVPNISFRTFCLHMGPAGRQAVYARWSRACSLEPDFLDSNCSPSFPVPGVGSFCLCSIGLTQVRPDSSFWALGSDRPGFWALPLTYLGKFLKFLCVSVSSSVKW